MTVTLDLSALRESSKLSETETVSTRRALASLSLDVAKSKRVVVVTGAGISCSSGIPDFRSTDGLYALVKSRYPDVVMKGRDLFDAALFRDPQSTALFYTFISGLKRSIDKASPSPTHDFIKTLDTKAKLVRSYTQNIDGLEERAGLLGTSSDKAKAKTTGKIVKKDVKNVQLHGDIHRVRCRVCSANFPCEESHMQVFQEGEAPDCPDCLSRCQARVARSARALKVGSLRPAIVLYDEPHPLGDDIAAIQTADLARKPDLLIIMGTSLKVHGLKRLVKEFAKTIHDAKTPGKVIFVNMTPPASEWAGVIDYHVMGATDEWVGHVLVDWKKSRPQDWETQQTLVAEKASDGKLKLVKSTTAAPSGKAKTSKASKENIPLASSSQPAAKKATAVPLSPSKRQTAVNSHYSEEGSPRKKPKTKSTRPQLEASERGQLFKKTTSTSALNGHAAKSKPKAKSSSRQQKAVPLSQTSSLVNCLGGLAMTSPMKVDIDDVFASSPVTPIKASRRRTVVPMQKPTRGSLFDDSDISMMSPMKEDADVSMLGMTPLRV